MSHITDYTYVVYSPSGKIVETFAGPLRLAAWQTLPEGYTIERIHTAIAPDLPGVTVTHEEVMQHAREWLGGAN